MNERGWGGGGKTTNGTATPPGRIQKNEAKKNKKNTLEERGDTWQGKSRKEIPTKGRSKGHKELCEILLSKGGGGTELKKGGRVD